MELALIEPSSHHSSKREGVPFANQFLNSALNIDNKGEEVYRVTKNDSPAKAYKVPIISLVLVDAPLESHTRCNSRA